MAANALDILGEILMARVRDKAIGDWDRILDGRMKGSTAQKVRSELEAVSSDAPAVIAKMVPRIVDTTLHHLLWTLEQEDSLELSVEAEGESTPSIRDESDGLTGELYRARGWIARFSRERHEEE